MKICGFIAIDKPYGMTSHDVVDRIRKILDDKNIIKVGHGGTLDKYATGVLPIGIGRAVKFIEFLNPQKEYIVKVKFGIKTDTYDIWGKIIDTKDANGLKQEDIKEIIESFVGVIEQKIPSYSCAHYKGTRLWKLARAGIKIEDLKKKVKIYKIEFQGYDESEKEATFYIRCGRGVYLRSLCDEIGEKVSNLGSLSYLRRLSCSGFFLKDTVNLSELDKQKLISLIIPVDKALFHLPKINLNKKLAFLISHGKGIYYPFDTLGYLRIYDYDENFIGIGEVREDKKEKKTIILPKRILSSDFINQD